MWSYDGEPDPATCITLQPLEVDGRRLSKQGPQRVTTEALQVKEVCAPLESAHIKI